MPDPQTPLSQLRAILHDAPSVATWNQLCNAFNAWHGDLDDAELALAIDYACAHLDAWPDALRWAPESWWRNVRRGLDEPRWDLVRSVRFRWTAQHAHNNARRLPELARLGHVTEVDLAQCHLGDLEARYLARSHALQRGLTALDLHDNAIGPLGAEALADAPHLDHLTHLTLRGNPIEGFGLRSLAQSDALAAVTRLHLDHTRLDTAGVVASIDTPLFDGLTALTLAHNSDGLSCEAAVALVTSPSAATLTELDLSDCNLGVEAARAIAASPYLGALRTLNLAQNPGIGPEGTRLLTDAVSLGQLKHLDLHRCRIGLEGARILAAPHALTGLEQLGLRMRDVGRNGSSILARSTTLHPDITRRWWR